MSEKENSKQTWDKVKVIGRGGSSTVYQCLLPDGQFLAVKEIVTDGMNADQIRGIAGEVDTIKNLSHPNIVRCFGLQRETNRLHIKLEYCDLGSLRKLYQKNGPLSEPQAARCMTQILKGLEYLHDNGVAHRDVKGANMLLSSSSSGGILKLADFGASKKMETESLVSGLKGTPHWMAPEVIKGNQMSTGWMKADVWSLGCTLVEIISASLPFSEYDNPMTAMYQIASGKVPPLPPSASPEAASFVEDCCAVDPESRPTVSTLLIHPFLLKCKSDVDENSFSEDSKLNECATSIKSIAPDGSTDTEILPSSLESDRVSEVTYVDDDRETSADVTRFMERAPRAPALSVRTTSFRVEPEGQDGEICAPAVPLECEDTPVMHRSRKSIHTLSSHNLLKVSDNRSDSSVSDVNNEGRPPLQLLKPQEAQGSDLIDGLAISIEFTQAARGSEPTDHLQAYVSTSSSHVCDSAAEVVEDNIMETVISPRLTSLKVTDASSSPKSLKSKQRTFSVGSTGGDLDGNISRVGTANVMPMKEAAEIHCATTVESSVNRSPNPAEMEVTSDIVINDGTRKSVDPLVSGPIYQVGGTVPNEGSGAKVQRAPVRRRFRTGKKQSGHHGPSPSDNVSNTHRKKAGVAHIISPELNSLDSENHQTSARNFVDAAIDEGQSMEIVFTASGGQKRKMKSSGMGVNKISSNNHKRNVNISGGTSAGTIDLAKSSGLPPIGVNQYNAGLSGKKKEKNVSCVLCLSFDVY